MLTEVDTRNTPSGEVSLWMDTDARVYLVAVEGYEPIPCLTRDYALQVWHHPFAYLPLEGSVSPPNATGGDSPTQTLDDPRLSDQTGRTLVDLRDVLQRMNDSDFHWTVSIISDLVLKMSRERGLNEPKPYDHETDGPDVPF